MTEIEQLLKLNYDECCQYLIKKYGQPKKNYFPNEECRSKSNGISRGKEGLFIHHIDEDKAIMLSDRVYAKMNPYSYQLANRLVYCNLLEHFVLHLKIMQYPHPNKNKNELVGFGGAFNFIIPELNDIFSGFQYKQEWKLKAVELIIDKIDDYYKCLNFSMVHFDIPIVFYLSSWNHLFDNSWEHQNEQIYQHIRSMYEQINNSKNK